MGEMTLDIEGWHKVSAADRPEPVERIHMHISEAFHHRLEAAEVALQQSREAETMIEVDPGDVDLDIKPDYGPLSDCSLRVYLDSEDRGHFHLVGHCQRDNSLVYSNAVLVDALV